MNTRTAYQAVAYVSVGVLNTLFGYSVYALGIFLGLHYAVAAFLSTCLGVLFNFKTTGVWVFGNRNNRLLPKFFAVYAFLYGLGLLVIMVLRPYMNDYLAGFCATLINACVGFLLNKFFVFRATAA